MSSDGPSGPAAPAIRAQALSKCYRLYDQRADRLWQILWRGRRRFFREFWALHDVSLEVAAGEVLGIVGRNGAGKSTLLQLVCGTLTPTSGTIQTRGRIAALLELGAGFNPEFSGRENVYMAASILGLTGREIDRRYEDIVEFSGVRDFIEQPVKTYSSGMQVRLAFSVATCVDADILVIDEALSVGDGDFARKSFDRIMALKEAGKTILFCSHATYYIEAMCTRALWLRDGRAEMVDEPGRVVAAYGAFLESGRAHGPLAAPAVGEDTASGAAPANTARITGLQVRADGRAGTRLKLRSRESTLEITLRFASDPALPAPSIGIGIIQSSGFVVASAGSFNDSFEIGRDAAGNGEATLAFPSLPLLKGEYTLNLYLLCERGLHMYDYALCYAALEVTQPDLEQGLVSLPHRWRNG